MRQRHGIRWAALFHLGRDRPICHQREIQQAVGIVKGWPQDLPARQILKGGRDTPITAHRACINRCADPKTGQGGAIGADQKNRLNHIAARLLDRQSRQIRIVK